MTKSATDSCRKHGFALVIALSILAFTILLIISIAALIKIEATQGKQAMDRAMARQNSLNGLYMALGQLQKYTGPDQRTTARADIDPALARTTQANGKWIGAYGSRVAADYSDRPIEISDKIETVFNSSADSLTDKGSQAILLNWLVSGNEFVEFNSLTDVDTDYGNVTLTASPNIPFTPNSTVDLTNLTVETNLTDPYALLVGPQSVASEYDYVAAPLVDIRDSQNSTTVGRYAWWATDENSKARINLQLEDPANTLAFANAARTGVELVDAIHPSQSVPSSNILAESLLGFNGAYDPTANGVTQLNNPFELPLLSPADADVLQDAASYRFHDLTTTSNSLLTDTYAGGLKQDLSAILSTTATSPADTDYIFVPDDVSDDDSTFPVPTWGQLRKYVQTTVAEDTDNPSGLQALEMRRPIAGVDSGLYPVITFAEVNFEYIREGNDFRLAIMPRIVLWNPYSMPIKAREDGMDLEFGMTSASNSWRLQANTDENETDVVTLDSRGMNTAAGTGFGGGSGQYTYVRFIVDFENVDIPPGESHIFTIQGSEVGKDYSINSTNYHTSAPTNRMTRGIENGYVLLPDRISRDPDATGFNYYRVAAGSNENGGFAKESSAYIGEITEQGPVNWDWENDSPSKPWYQHIPYQGYASGGESSHRVKTLQPEDKSNFVWTTFDSFDTLPGEQQWGVQFESAFGYRTRWMATNSPISLKYQDIYPHMATSVQVYDLVMSSLPESQHRVSAGIDLDVISDKPRDAVLFQYRPADQPLLSIGQLQHANLSVWDSFSTPYAIGNSPAPVEVSYNKSTRESLFRNNSLYDYSYLLNRALWDQYFVSTVPHDGTNASGILSIPNELPNPRMKRIALGETNEAADLMDSDKAASRLVIEGGFNINSTSEQAWRAILSGANQTTAFPDGTLDDSEGAALSRFAQPLDAASIDGTTYDWAFKGYRRLNEEQIAKLASNIVGEIRNRGPFVSLHDFINRRLWDNPDTVKGAKYPDINNPGSYISTSPYSHNGDETIKGALQDAIDATPATGSGSINNERDLSPFNGSPSFPSYIGSSKDDTAAIRGGTGQYPQSSPSAYAPQFLTQADILSTIGSSLSARSDTFLIRSYGDTVNPVTGEIVARAWCEAVVQRVVEPVLRASSDPSSPDYNEPAPRTTDGSGWGRRYEIVSLRWLNPQEI
ncbi:MAG: hypothetical protein ACQKBT_12525 [Puniceicoccales bacterium]